MSKEPDITFIMARDDKQKLRLWACRGEGKGCKRNKARENKKPCEDCFGPCDGNMTVGELKERLKQGDA